ncbi:MAG: hypothetical protein H0U35_08545 [Sporichthyaceae bacterium]|nr:hypothetical protein [Sporichthyaceae bacterium]
MSSSRNADASFDAYRLAFERSDAAAIADHFAYLSAPVREAPLGAEQR